MTIYPTMLACVRGAMPFPFPRCAPVCVSPEGRSAFARLFRPALGEVKRRAVDAIAQPRRPRPVGKDMAEVAFARRAAHFGADHAVAGVAMLADRGGARRRGIAGPARSAVIFGAARSEEHTAELQSLIGNSY